MTKRKKFSIEYNVERIKLATGQGNKVTPVANDIGLNETTVRRWVKEYTTYGESAFPGK